ncbi:MAG: HDOD domain-containing protein [Myxococcota bacterium]
MSGELALLGKVLQLAGDAEAEIQEFVETVGQSPNLAARVVQVSNSALYGMEGRVQRLDRGVLILGVDTVAGIATSVVVAERAKRVKIPGMPADALWLHSLVTGICAEILARSLGLPVYREAYLAGLLHDLGIIDLCEQENARCADLVVQAPESHCPLYQLEREKLGRTHGELLAESAEEWGLPEPLRMAIRFHDSPGEAPEHSRTLASLLLASHALTQELSGWSDDPPDGAAQAELEGLGIDLADLEDLRDLVAERLKTASRLFS